MEDRRKEFEFEEHQFVAPSNFVFWVASWECFIAFLHKTSVSQVLLSSFLSNILMKSFRSSSGTRGGGSVTVLIGFERAYSIIVGGIFVEVSVGIAFVA